MNVSHLTRLPNEAILHILSFVPKTGLQNLCRVNKAFKELAEDQNLWRFFCEPADKGRNYKVERITAVKAVISAMNKLFRLNLRSGDAFAIYDEMCGCLKQVPKEKMNERLSTFIGWGRLDLVRALVQTSGYQVTVQVVKEAIKVGEGTIISQAELATHPSLANIRVTESRLSEFYEFLKEYLNGSAKFLNMSLDEYRKFIDTLSPVPIGSELQHSLIMEYVSRVKREGSFYNLDLLKRHFTWGNIKTVQFLIENGEVPDQQLIHSMSGLLLGVPARIGIETFTILLQAYVKNAFATLPKEKAGADVSELLQEIRDFIKGCAIFQYKKKSKDYPEIKILADNVLACLDDCSKKVTNYSKNGYS